MSSTAYARGATRSHPNVSPQHTLTFRSRRQWIVGLFIVVILLLVGRASYLQLIRKDFLQTQGDARYQRVLTIPAYRGMLLDRFGEPLAISTPIESVWVNPKQFSNLSTLATAMEMSVTDLQALVAKRSQREFVYVKRHVAPSVAERVRTLNLPGVFLQQEYRRYYPMGEITGHIVGFTNIDDQGQEGLELALDKSLRGQAGAKRVLQDRESHIISELETLQAPQAGHDIRLTIDHRFQYFAYRELKTAVQATQARGGSAVLLDSRSGEILALVNQPAYNPNDRQDRQSERYRNRAVTDVFEPGSTLKPFTLATALESGHYTPTTRVNTRPGSLKVGRFIINDGRNYGSIDLRTIIQRSSNVGASKIGLSLPSKLLWHTLHAVGFGQETHSGFPGEVAGRLPHFSQWHPTEHATLSFGYGLNVTALQLARAYAVLGNGGWLPPLQLILKENQTPDYPQVMRAGPAREVLTMLEAVVQEGGTGTQAQVPGYRVAGKTGTARKVVNGDYSPESHVALFAGIAPVEQPQFVLVVLLDEPQGDDYYGGKVAAPVFAKIMATVLRLSNVASHEIN